MGGNWSGEESMRISQLEVIININSRVRRIEFDYQMETVSKLLVSFQF